jgi:hypothetical protein
LSQLQTNFVASSSTTSTIMASAVVHLSGGAKEYQVDDLTPNQFEPMEKVLVGRTPQGNILLYLAWYKFGEQRPNRLFRAAFEARLEEEAVDPIYDPEDAFLVAVNEDTEIMQPLSPDDLNAMFSF